MPRVISDDEIRVFLRRNADQYSSQISLIQAAVNVLWPEGVPTGGAERVVRACLDSARSSLSPTTPTGRLLSAPGTGPF